MGHRAQRRPAVLRLLPRPLGTPPLDASKADWLDDAFPLGDGVAESAADVICPYCAAEVELLLDPGGGPLQRYVEDCEVCCRPWTVEVRWNAAGEAAVQVTTEEEA